MSTRTKILPRWFFLSQPSLKQAFLLSVLVHIAFLLLVALAVAHFGMRPDDSPLPPKLEFTFLPDAEEEQQLHLAQEETSRQSTADATPHSLNTPVPPASTKAFENESKENRDEIQSLASAVATEPLTTNDPGTFVAETSPTPNDMQIIKDPAPLKSTFLYSHIRERSLVEQIHINRNLRLAETAVAVTPLESARVLRKITQIVDRLPTRFSDTTFAIEQNDQNYSVGVRHLPAPTAMDLDELELNLQTVTQGQKLVTQMRMRRLAFSQFAQFVDTWDPIVVIHDDVLDGRFHTNSDFRISASNGVMPRFYGKVSTSGSSIAAVDQLAFVDEDSVFGGGIETGVPAIEFPRKFNELISGATSDDSLAQVFVDETWIRFQPDGSFAWRSGEQKDREQQRKIPSATFSIVGKKGAVLHVKGIVRGKVLVFSQHKIMIDGSLTYAHFDPSQKGGDYLGLVCEKDIEIAPPNVTGPGDLHIDAAILAKRYFRVRNLYGAGKAKLNIYGSLSAGILSATEPRYATRIHFDKRLENHRPPNFPMSDRYELLDWNQIWKVVLPE